VAELDESRVVTEEVSCPLCDASDSRLFLRTDNLRRGTRRLFEVVECTGCGFRYTRAPPTPASMRRYYPETYPSLAPGSASLAERAYYTLFRRLPAVKRGRLLDVGCGSGKYLRHMKRRGWEVFGQDLSPVPPAARHEHAIFEGELHDAGYPTGFFDAITLWWSIEHIRRPLRALLECHRVLRKGGTLVVATTNSSSFEAALFKRYWHHLLVPEHYSQFTDQTLSTMLARAGFAVRGVRHDLLSLGLGASLLLLLKSRRVDLPRGPLSRIGLGLLFLPLDLLAAARGRSALITAYATT
jgi:SAM-dependent methyltransferase